MPGPSVAIRFLCISAVISFQTVLRAVSGQPPQSGECVLPGKFHWVQKITFSQDGNLLAAGDSAGEVMLWHAGSKTKYGSFRVDGGPISALDFAPDGVTLAVACGERTRDEYRISPDGFHYKKTPASGEITIWNLKEKERPNLTQRLASNLTCALSYGKDGVNLFAGQWETGAVTRWDLATGKAKRLHEGFCGNDHLIDFDK